MKKISHLPAWGVTVVIFLVLWLPRIIQRTNNNTVFQRLGQKTCEIYKDGSNLTQRQAFVNAMKEMNLTKDTKYAKGTEDDLPTALEQCGISYSTLRSDAN